MRLAALVGATRNSVPQKALPLTELKNAAIRGRNSMCKGQGCPAGRTLALVV
jgi:hypothetical protein